MSRVGANLITTGRYINYFNRKNLRETLIAQLQTVVIDVIFFGAIVGKIVWLGVINTSANSRYFPDLIKQAAVGRTVNLNAVAGAA